MYFSRPSASISLGGLIRNTQGLPRLVTVDALDANVKPFVDRGGKLIQYHGWSDPQISPSSSVQYYARAVEAIADQIGRKIHARQQHIRADPRSADVRVTGRRLGQKQRLAHAAEIAQ